MKYLTKEWCELYQRTGLYFGMKVNKDAAIYDETRINNANFMKRGFAYD